MSCKYSIYKLKDNQDPQNDEIKAPLKTQKYY